MTVGPVEYIILAFPENRFSGEIAPALDELTKSGTIRILDLVFITKDADGNVAGVEVEQLDELEPFNSLEGEVGGLLTEEDIEYAAHDLEPNSSAALLIWEDTWATPLVEALRDSGGVLIEGSRVPHELMEAALEEVSAAR
jgi:uncharacterized membrane protein